MDCIKNIVYVAFPIPKEPDHIKFSGIYYLLGCVYHLRTMTTMMLYSNISFVQKSIYVVKICNTWNKPFEWLFEYFPSIATHFWSSRNAMISHFAHITLQHEKSTSW